MPNYPTNPSRLTIHRFRIALVAMLLFLFTACSGPEPHLWLHAPDWGLAKIVATTHLDQPTQLVEDDNGRLYLFTISNQLQPTVVALDSRATTRWQTSLPDATPTLTNPRLLSHDGRLFLFWQDASEASSNSAQAVYGAILNEEGAITTPATQLVEQSGLDSYDVAISTSGEVALWWGGTLRLPGVWAAQLPADWRQTAVFTQLSEDGRQPAIQFDSQGTLHASWHLLQLLGSSTVTHFYVALPDGNPETVVSPIQIAAEPLRSGSLMQGPFLTIVDEQVNLVWTELLRSGRGAGNGRSVTAQFPVGQPQPVDPQLLRLPSLRQSYTPATDGLQAGARILPTERDQQFGISPAQMTFAEQNGSEMAFALPQRLPQGRLIVGQIGVGYLREGQSSGIQLLSQSDTASFRPSIAVSADEYVHVSWLRRMEPEGFAVYLASTEPQLQDALSELSSLDYQRMLADTVTSILQGAVFTPFAFLLWMLIPMLLFLLTIPFRREAISFQARSIQISLWLGLIVYLIVKLVTMRGLWAYQPFSATIPILPNWLGLVLQIVLPLLSLWLAWRAAHWLTERSETESAVFFVTMFVAVDAFFTMTFYGDTLLSLL